MKTKRGQKWLCGIGILTVCFMLTGCCMSHEWQEATCLEPKTCTKCGKTEGEVLGHTWVEATCAEPKHCSTCGETEGNALGHTWIEATCAEPRHCSTCGETEGSTLEHTLTEANYQQPATCTVCGETVGEPLTAYFEEDGGTTCDAELNTPYPYTVLCYSNHDYTTTGKLTFSDYEIFASDETYEALDGYEWRAITLTFTFDDDNAQNYGFGIFPNAIDYYSEEASSSAFEKTYTINYNGKDYDECIREYEKLQDTGWVENSATMAYRLVMRVPEGYDGVVAYAYTDIPDTTIEPVYFRLK